MSIDTDTALTLVVEGMSCEHCKVAITGEVSRVSGVESVDVDIDAKRVRVRGADLDAGAVGFRLETERFTVGEYVSIKEDDGRFHTFQVISVKSI